MPSAKPFRFTLPLFFLLLSAPAWAGPHAGGVLLVHAFEPPYSGGNYCAIPAPSDCHAITTTVEDGGELTAWMVYAVFSDENEPSLRGVEFGINYSADLRVENAVSCASYEQSLPGWPASGSGTQLIWDVPQTERVLPIYWFAGYVYAGQLSPSDPATFAIAPHPENGGQFGDGSVVPVLDTIAGYGALGFETPGFAPCPEPAQYWITPDGAGDYATIQEAIDIAAPGSVIELADGVYRGNGNRDLDFNDTAMTLRSRSGNPENCIIDCEGSYEDNHRGVVVRWRHDAGPRVEGIKIINGFVGNNGDPNDGGGGIDLHYDTKLTIVNCIVENCQSVVAGGGIGSGKSELLIQDCIIRNNTCGGPSGGGLSADQATITLENCRFEDNSFDGDGGGLRLSYCNLVAKDCQFIGNDCDRGGGVALSQSESVFESCTWYGNEATWGGAVHGIGGTIELDRCTIARNHAAVGSAIRLEGGTEMKVFNSILAFGVGDDATSCNNATLVAHSTDVYGNEGDWEGCLSGQETIRGNLSVAPMFCDIESGDLTLDRRSPCAMRADVRRGILGAWPVACGPTADPLESEQERLAFDRTGAPSASVSAAPNPFTQETVIGYRVESAGERVRVDVYDATGRFVRNLVDETSASGEHSTRWNGRDEVDARVSGGAYFCRIQVGDQVISKRLTMVP